MVFQKCIPISLILMVEVINLWTAWRIERPFNYKVINVTCAINV
jgi:hypothetical protein